MIHVHTHVGPSPIAGVGLFLDEPIAKGTLVYSDDPRFVVIISDEERALMPEGTRSSMDRYTYRGRGEHKLEGATYYCVDDGRFMNHADEPTLVYDEEEAVWRAATHLPAGIELTCDYRIFEDPKDWEPFLKEAEYA